MAVLHITIGMPASGKTTWAKNWVKNHPETILVDSDAIRAELYGDEECQDNPAKVFRLMEKRAIEALLAGKDVVYCATNISYKNRKNILARVRAKGFETRAVVFATPIKECKRRNQARARVVPEFVFDRMQRQFMMPTHWEGFDFIDIIYTEGKEDGVYYLTLMVDFNQKNPHHSLTLDRHCTKAQILGREYGVEIEQAALWHDVGKIFTQTFDDNGVAHYYQHECYSGYIALCCGLSPHVCALISWHMAPYLNHSALKLMDSKFYDDLMKLHKCDVGAH